MRSIWIIDEGSPGHLTQSLGLANALARRVPAELVQLRVRLKLRGFARPLLRRWLGDRRAMGPRLLRFVYELPDGVPASSPDLILSSGGKSVFAAVSLSRQHQIPFVFCGPPAPFPLNWFFGILSPTIIGNHPRKLQTDALVTPMAPETVEPPGNALRERIGVDRDQRLAALLVGGASRSHRYRDDEWRTLGHAVNQLHRTTGIQWLITTSRRTSTDAESAIRSTVDGAAVAKAVWWHQEPQKTVAAYLGAADYVFVTQDSLSMASEAVAAGKQVILVAPADVRHSDLLEGIIGHLLDKRRAVRTTINELGKLELGTCHWNPVSESPVEQYATVVLKWLHWL